ncbi:MAG TPA: zinc ribbon domain-containing protein [Candidatus Wallbacteria bacterium]|nr:zinc ribbon domain-containing protein [Candidatus Wallbacteria bacterium]
MPIFEFKCSKCGTVFEKIQMKRDPNPACASCGSEKTDKMVSIFGFTGGEGAKSSASTDHSCGSCSSHNCGSCHH